MQPDESAAFAMFAAVHEGRDRACEALQLNRSELLHPQEIAPRLDVSVDQVWWWLGEFLLMMLGYPRQLAAARARSAHTAPRHPDTTRVFDSLVRDIFVPELKAAGFKKTRNVWRRRTDGIEVFVDIQRGHSTGDLLDFTSNWYVRIEGFAVRSRRDVVVAGRIGDFLDQGRDRWWSVQLGWLTGHSPTAVTDSEECRREIAEGLRRTIAWLDDIDTRPKLLAALEPDDLPVHFRGPSILFPTEPREEVLSALRAMNTDADP